ncbi:MAG: RNA polymerase sigma-54 factor, partial [Bacteroidaceae bacterium]
MNQKNIQAGTLQQKMEQTQSLSPQQVMVARLTEMSVEALKGRIENECQENPWLEKADNLPDHDPESEPYDYDGGQPSDEHADYKAEDDYSSEDDIPDYLLRPTGGTRQAENIEWADTQTFYDRLKEQAGEFDLTDKQQRIMDYLIGSLEDSGMLTKPILQIADELEIYQGIPATPEEVEEVLHVIWQFDPPGIGARSMQECLLIQVARKEQGETRRLMDTVIRHFYDEFIKKHWDVIQQQMQLSTTQMGMLQHELLRLNPRPGSALGESMAHATNQITPDFIVDTDTDGNITMTLNEGDLP